MDTSPDIPSGTLPRPTLWSIDERVRNLEAALDELETDHEEVLAAFAHELDDAQGQLKEKIDGTAALIRHLEATAKARKEEADRLAALAKSDAAKADRIKAFLLDYLRVRDIERMETARFRLSVARNGGKIPVEYAGIVEDLPDEMKRISVAPDLDRIREALEAGEEIPGARLGERGVRLSIR